MHANLPIAEMSASFPDPFGHGLAVGAMSGLFGVGGAIGAQVGTRPGTRPDADTPRALPAGLVLAVAARIAVDLVVEPAGIHSVTEG